jgi:hypothetical protein
MAFGAGIHPFIHACRLNVICAVAMVGLVGCGGGGEPAPDLGAPLEVGGKITMDGAPANGVNVTFARIDGDAPPDARQFTATTDANGQYKFPKVYEASYRVMIEDPNEPKQEMAAVETGKYRNYGVNSTLVAKVTAGSLEFNYELSSK